MITLLLDVLLIKISSMPYGYLGPGMSGGVIAAILGIFAAILLGFWGILYYPIKRALKKRALKKQEEKNKFKNEQ